MKNQKIYITFLITIMALPILSACTNGKRTAVRNIENVGSDNTKQATDSTTSANKIPADTNEQLTIEKGCIGCGRCIIADHEHFARAAGDRIPLVRSQTNLDSVSLNNAINICPVKVISLK